MAKPVLVPKPISKPTTNGQITNGQKHAAPTTSSQKNGQGNTAPFQRNGQNWQNTKIHTDPVLSVEERIEGIEKKGRLIGLTKHLKELKKLHGENNIAPFSRREVENQAEISTIPEIPEVVSTVPEIKSENISAKNEAVVEPKTQTPKKEVLEKKQENLIKVEQKLETQREDKTKPEALPKIEPIQQKTQEQIPAPKIPSKESLINKQEISKIPEKLATTPFNNSQKIENKDNKKDSFPQTLPKKEKLPDNFQTTQVVKPVHKGNIDSFQRSEEIDANEKISPKFKPPAKIPVIQKVDEPKTTTYGLINNNKEAEIPKYTETGNGLNNHALGNHDLKTTTQQPETKIPQQSSPSPQNHHPSSKLGIIGETSKTEYTTQNSQKQELEKSVQTANSGNNLRSTSQTPQTAQPQIIQASKTEIPQNHLKNFEKLVISNTTDNAPALRADEKRLVISDLNINTVLPAIFDTEFIFRCLLALLCGTSGNLYNKFGQISPLLYKLDPTLPFQKEGNIFNSFLKIIEGEVARDEPYILARVCKESLDKANDPDGKKAKECLSLLSTHFKNENNRRAWTSLLLVSSYNNGKAEVWSPLETLPQNYQKLPLINSLVNKALGIMDGIEPTASGNYSKDYQTKFKKEIWTKYEEIKSKDPNGITLRNGFLAEITTKYAHRLIKEVAKSTKWNLADGRLGPVLPGGILETEVRLFVAVYSNNPNEATILEIQIIQIVAGFLIVKFYDYLQEIVNEEIRKRSREKNKVGNGLANAVVTGVGAGALVSGNLGADVKNLAKGIEGLASGTEGTTNKTEYNPTAEFDKNTQNKPQEPENLIQKVIESTSLKQEEQAETGKNESLKTTSTGQALVGQAGSIAGLGAVAGAGLVSATTSQIPAVAGGQVIKSTSLKEEIQQKNQVNPSVQTQTTSTQTVGDTETNQKDYSPTGKFGENTKPTELKPEPTQKEIESTSLESKKPDQEVSSVKTTSLPVNPNSPISQSGQAVVGQVGSVVGLGAGVIAASQIPGVASGIISQIPIASQGNSSIQNQTQTTSSPITGQNGNSPIVGGKNGDTLNAETAGTYNPTADFVAPETSGVKPNSAQTGNTKTSESNSQNLSPSSQIQNSNLSGQVSQAQAGISGVQNSQQPNYPQSNNQFYQTSSNGQIGNPSQLINLTTAFLAGENLASGDNFDENGESNSTVQTAKPNFDNLVNHLAPNSQIDGQPISSILANFQIARKDNPDLDLSAFLKDFLSKLLSALTALQLGKIIGKLTEIYTLNQPEIITVASSISQNPTDKTSEKNLDGISPNPTNKLNSQSPNSTENSQPENPDENLQKPSQNQENTGSKFQPNQNQNPEEKQGVAGQGEGKNDKNAQNLSQDQGNFSPTSFVPVSNSASPQKSAESSNNSQNQGENSQTNPNQPSPNNPQTGNSQPSNFQKNPGNLAGKPSENPTGQQQGNNSSRNLPENPQREPTNPQNQAEKSDYPKSDLEDNNEQLPAQGGISNPNLQNNIKSSAESSQIQSEIPNGQTNSNGQSLGNGGNKGSGGNGGNGDNPNQPQYGDNGDKARICADICQKNISNLAKGKWLANRDNSDTPVSYNSFIWAVPYSEVYGKVWGIYQNQVPPRQQLKEGQFEVIFEQKRKEYNKNVKPPSEEKQENGGASENGQIPVNPNSEQKQNGNEQKPKSENNENPQNPEQQNPEETEPSAGGIIPQGQSNQMENQNEQNDELDEKQAKYEEGVRKTGKENVDKERKSGKNQEEQDNGEPNSQGQNSNNSSSLGDKIGSKIKNSDLGQKVANSPFGKAAGNALNKINQAKQIMADPAKFALDKIRDELVKKAATQVLGWAGSFFTGTVGWVLIGIFVALLIWVGANGVAYCIKDEKGNLDSPVVWYNVVETLWQSGEGIFDAAENISKGDTLAALGNTAGFVFNVSPAGIILNGSAALFNGGRIPLKSKIGKWIAEACGVKIDPCATGGAASLGGGSGVVGSCLATQLAGKSDNDTISLWAGNGGKLRQVPIKVKIIKEVIEAGKKAGVDSNTVAFVLSITATESAVENPWRLVGGSGNVFYGIAQVGDTERRDWGNRVGGYKGDDYFLNNPDYQMKIIEVGLKEKIGFGCAPGKRSDIYEGAYAWLTCDGVDGFGTTSIAYAEAAEKNFTIANCTGGNDLPINTTEKAVWNFNIFGPVNAYAADKYQWINPVDTNETRFNTSTGKFTSYDKGSGGVDVRLGFPGKSYEESKLVPLVAHLQGEVVYAKDRGSATTVELSYGTEIGIYYPDLKTAEFPNGVTVYYAHLNDIQNNPATGKQWQPGDKIAPGQRFGTQGASGSLRPFGDNYLIDITIKPGKDGASRGEAINGLNEIYNQLWLGMLTYYDQNTNKILASNFSPTEGIGSGSDNLNCDCPAGYVWSGSGTIGGSQATSGIASTPDQWTALTLAILESPTLQGRLDVLVVIANRVGNVFGGYGTTVRDQAFASGQFEPFFNGISREDIKDRESAVAALGRKGYSQAQAAQALDELLKATTDPAKVGESESKIKNFVYFKGVSEYKNMQSGDFLRQYGENFFHSESGDPYNYKPFPISSLFGQKSGFNYLPHPTELYAKLWGGVEVSAAEMLDLKQIADQTGAQSIVIQDVATGKIQSYNGDKSPNYGPASTIKTVVVDSILQKVKSGEIKLDDTITIPESLRALDSKYSKALSDDKGKTTWTVREAIAAALGPSSNTATNALVYKLSGSTDASAVNSILSSSGYSNTRFNNFLNLPGRGPKAVANGGNSSTALEITKSLSNLNSGTGEGYDLARQAMGGGAGGYIGNGDDPISKGINGYILGKAGSNSEVTGNTALVEIGGKKYIITTFVDRADDNAIIDTTGQVISKIGSGTVLNPTPTAGTPNSSSPDTATGNGTSNGCFCPVKSSLNNFNFDLSNNIFAKFWGGVDVEAQTTTPPTDYNSLSEAHKKFLDEIAKAKNYTGPYEDAGGLNTGLQNAFNEMKKEALKSGLDIEIVSGYRPYKSSVGDSQMVTFFQNGPASGRGAKIKEFWVEGMTPEALTRVKEQYLTRAENSAPPGYSEHHTGLAIDIQIRGRTDLDNANYPAALYDFLTKNGAKFGFVQSYKAGNTQGAGEEKWHWRWDGTQITDPLNNKFPNEKPINNNPPNPTSPTTATGNVPAGCVPVSGGTTNTTPGANGMVAPETNAVPKLTEAMAKLESLTGKFYGSGTCYEGVADAIDIAGFGGLGGTGKADVGENTVRNLLPGYTTGADDFWRFFNDNPSRLDKYGIRDLKKELGIIDPTDKRIPAGAVIVIGPDYFRETSPSSKAAIYGDINVKMPNGDFLNPRSMGNWMTTTDWKANPNFVRGIYVPK